MNELVFPLVAIGLVLLVVIPVATLISAKVLVRRRGRARSWQEFGSDGTLAWVLAPTVLPLVWLASATIHQLESSEAWGMCSVDHVGAAFCLDVALLLALVVGGVGTVVVRSSRRSRVARGWASCRDEGLRRRVRALCSAHPVLQGLRLEIVEDAPAATFAHGVWRPSVVLDAGFASTLDDASLVAALLHEAAHAQNRDPLLVLASRMSLSLNPLASLLRPELDRWLQAREAFCDAQAVANGAERLALAQAIVRALRWRPRRGLEPLPCCLTGQHAAAQRLRLQILLEPVPSPPRGSAMLLTPALLGAVTLSPHFFGRGLLEYLHYGVEVVLMGTGLNLHSW